jgi:hypothetical protein
MQLDAVHLGVWGFDPPNGFHRECTILGLGQSHTANHASLAARAAVVDTGRAWPFRADDSPTCMIQQRPTFCGLPASVLLRVTKWRSLERTPPMYGDDPKARGIDQPPRNAFLCCAGTGLRLRSITRLTQTP